MTPTKPETVDIAVMGHWEGSQRGRRYTVMGAAGQKELVIVHRGRCHRTVNFLATDLATFLDPLRDVYQPPFPCSKCNQADMIKVTVRQPMAGNYGHLVVRRPAGVRRTRLWKTMLLGDESSRSE